MNIIGINAYHGDVSAVLVRDGELVCAVEEERFRRVKHWAGFPSDSIRSCLELGGLEPGEVDVFAVSRDPKAHLLRKIAYALRRRPGLALLRDRAANQRRVHEISRDLAACLDLDPAYAQSRTKAVEHHPAHLASSFFVSPFEEAAVAAIDGFGDFVSTSFARGRGSRLEVFDRVFFPHSLGLLYLAVTQFLGFPKYGDEFKVMGLAPYGAPDFADEIRELVHLGPRGSFQLDLSYFRHWSDGVSMTWEAGPPEMGPVFTPKLEALLGPARKPGDPLEPRHEALASSLQAVFEQAYFHVLAELHRRTGLTRLCLAGGCAMNSVANGKVRERTPFEDLFIQPASGDNGTALGAAYYVWNHAHGGGRRFVMEHSNWGPSFSEERFRECLAARRDALDELDCRIELFDEDALCAETAERIADGKIVGWFQGRMEWGARALGNRSILADPRRRDMRNVINQKIKFREKFRPFAPAILEEAVDEYFAHAPSDPFMLHVYPIRPDKRGVIPAVTHVDGTGRLQTVSARSNERFWKLIQAFRARTGVPVLLNTSFNENEPIVLRPEEALDVFLRTRMDVLVLGGLLVEKRNGEDRSKSLVSAELASETHVRR